MFGGNSPFAIWYGSDPREWENFPTPDSLFLTKELGAELRLWVRELHLFLESQGGGMHFGRPCSESMDLSKRGLALCESIREEVPYYYVNPVFLNSMPSDTRKDLDSFPITTRAYRRLDDKGQPHNPPTIEFFPFDHSVSPYGQNTLSGVVIELARRLRLPNLELGQDFWEKLDRWQIAFADNYLGLPEQRGGKPRWKSGFDRLQWLADGISLQQEASVRSQNVRLNCRAAMVAISKSEWDTLLEDYNSRPAD